jgi:hypothetical protein
LECAKRSGLGHVPTFLISPWKEGHKLSRGEVLQLKQLRNFTESNRQNDGSIYLYFKLKISGDLHLLLRLINNWETYKKKPELFHEENLAFLTLNTTRKLFTLAKFYGLPEHGESLEVLRKWLAMGDGSRFLRAHLEFPEIKELSESGRVQALKAYAAQPLR